jgi:hypothetical protein
VLDANRPGQEEVGHARALADEDVDPSLVDQPGGIADLREKRHPKPDRLVPADLVAFPHEPQPVSSSYGPG